MADFSSKDATYTPAPPTPASTPRPPLTPSSPPPPDPKQSADLGSSPLSSCVSSDENDDEKAASSDSGNSSVGDPSYTVDQGLDLEEEDEDEDEAEESGASSTGGLRETVLWSDETTALLREAAHKLPNLGKRHYTVEGASYGRNGLIGEYIRRRTGVVRDRFQVHARLNGLVRAAKDNSDEVAKLRGATSPREDLRCRKWATFLGPDLFPHTKPKHEGAMYNDHNESDLPPPKKKQRKSKAAPTRSASSSAKPTNGKKPQDRKIDKQGQTVASLFPPSRKDTQVEYAANPFEPRSSFASSSNLSSVPAASLFGPSVFAILAPPAWYTATPRGLLQPPSRSAPTFTSPGPLLSTPSPPTASSSAVPLLTALLTATSPHRDPSPLVHALLTSGFSTSSNLVDFLSLDNSALGLFLEELGKRNGLGPLDLAWVRKAFEAARREVAGV